MESTEQPKEPVIEQESTPEIIINQAKLDRYMAELKLDQNLSFGVLAGVAASLLSAVLWAVITVATQFQIGYMAIAVGLIVGFTVRFAGKGLDKIFGIVGAGLALFGCLAGNFLSIIGFVANAENLGYWETFSIIDFALVPEIMLEAFHPMDLFFYGLATYEGYKFAFRQITEQEIIANAAEKTV